MAKPQLIGGKLTLKGNGNATLLMAVPVIIRPILMLDLGLTYKHPPVYFISEVQVSFSYVSQTMSLSFNHCLTLGNVKRTQYHPLLETRKSAF